MPFRQIFTVLIAMIAIVLAALFVLSWDDGDGNGPAAPDDGEDGSEATTTTSSSSTTTTLVPVTTSIPADCATAEDPDAASSTTAPITTTTLDDDENTETPEPLIPTLGRNSSLSTVGLDTVTFGLTVKQATQAAGTEMANCDPVSDCYRVTPEDAPTGISFLVHEGTIERVDIVGDSPITTVSGAGIGATAAELDELFGDRLERVDLGGGLTDVIFVPADENDQEFRVAFTTADGVVQTLRSGRVPLVLETDPCG